MIYDEISSFYYSYNGEKRIIGRSVYDRNIYALHTGGAGKKIVAAYAVHGREWITARLALVHLEEGLAAGWSGWIIPLVNPDGACISQTVCPLWKANGRGVDINCNFDAAWGTGVLNTSARGSENCKGDFPFSEPEAAALRDFTIEVNPDATFAFHTKGEEIYWEFLGRGERRGAEILSAATGYRAKIITGSAGGYKDWCLLRGIPSYTIECGGENLRHPIENVSALEKCYKVLKIFTTEWN